MGYLIHLLHQKYPQLQYCGMDISVSTIDRLKNNFTEASWHTYDIQKPIAPEHGNRYDIVICSEVLEHCEDYQIALKNLTGLTAPGGTILITIPGGPRYRIDTDIGHLRHFSLKEASELFSPEQTRVRRAYRWGFPFLNLMRWTTDLLYSQVTRNFVNATWSWKQLIFCHCIYALMFLSWPNSGSQIVCVFDKTPAPKK
jgi:SAM-dependent methyltransferase